MFVQFITACCVTACFITACCITACCVTACCVTACCSTACCITACCVTACCVTACCVTACCRGEVDDVVWRFLLTGGVALENPHPNPFPDWLSEKSWGEIVRASSLPKLKGLMDKFDPRWKELYDSPSPHESPFPELWESELKDLDRYHVHCIVGIVVALGTASTVGEVHT